MDDIQGNWLEDISKTLVETHIENEADVVLGVIPQNLDNMIPYIKDWYSNHKDVVEIAQHGLNHTVVYRGKTYDRQQELIKMGKNIFLSIGVEPKTFIPPFSELDNTTLKVLSENGYEETLTHTGKGYSSGNILVISNVVFLCESEYVGYNCTIKKTEKIVEEIEKNIDESGVAVIFYHIQDFATEENILDTEKHETLKDIISFLKNSGKYEFMTANEYHHKIS